MIALLSPKAQTLIEETLKPIMEANRKIEHMKMMVSPESKLAQCTIVQTEYGKLRIVKNYHLSLGESYLIEDISKGFMFAWIKKL